MAKTLARDTSPEAEAALLEVLSRSPAWRKFQMVEESNRLTKSMVASGIRARHADLSAQQIRYKLFEAMLGAELAAAAYRGRRENR